MKTILNRLCFILAVSILLTGCEGKKVAEKPKPEPIVGKTTQDITEYDPAAGKVVSEGKYESSLVKMAMGNARAYGSAVENIQLPRVNQLIEMHRAATGEYPKTHQEFMDEVIYKNDYKLVMLPHGSSYQYDVANHKVIVVKEKADE